LVSSDRSLRSLLDHLWLPLPPVARWLRSERSERLETTHLCLLRRRVLRPLVSSDRSLRSLLDHLWLPLLAAYGEHPGG